MGALPVSPLVTTTYHLTATNAAGAINDHHGHRTTAAREAPRHQAMSNPIAN